MKRTPKKGDLVRVEWLDIQSDSSWKHAKEEDLKPCECVTYGVFNDQKDGYSRFFASYADEDVGDRIAIPTSVITNITVLKKGIYGRRKPRKAKRLSKGKRA